MFFLSRRWRPNLWPLYGFMAIEFGLTVALLTLAGIASPNLYRKKLWQDGADNGFNSSPSAGLYAAANYRSYKTPMVWSQFITNYNLVIVVLSMFLLLTKSTMYILHVFPPVLSVAVHSLLVAIFAVAVRYQAGSDMSDPTRPQPGPPWYLTKSCSVAHDQSLIGYCQQAKATFACFCVMLALFLGYLCLSVWSCFPSKTHQAQYAEKMRLRKERWAHLDEPRDTMHADKEVGYNSYAIDSPETPEGGHNLGTMNPMTPRTQAFNILGGTRNQTMKKESEAKPAKSKFSNLRNSVVPRGVLGRPVSSYEDESEGDREGGASPAVASSSAYTPASTTASPAPQMYFPPPPKTSTKK